MHKGQIKIGGKYGANVSGKRTIVQIVSESPYGGWNAINIKTGHSVRIKTAGRLHSLFFNRAQEWGGEDTGMHLWV